MQVTYLDGSIINKSLPARLEWILQGVISLKFYYFSRISFTRLPFRIDLSNDSSSSTNYLGLFISLGVVVFVCLVCSVCFYKCSRIIIENANRRLEQRRRMQMNNINLNLMPAEEENLRVKNNEILKKMLETDLKPIKYSEGINHYHTNCTVCLEDFTSDCQVIFLFCKHIFHFNCLKDWLDKNILLPKCPNCNYNILTGGQIDLINHNNNENQNLNLNENNFNLNNNLNKSSNNNNLINDLNNPNNNYLLNSNHFVAPNTINILSANNNLATANNNYDGEVPKEEENAMVESNLNNSKNKKLNNSYSRLDTKQKKSNSNSPRNINKNFNNYHSNSNDSILKNNDINKNSNINKSDFDKDNEINILEERNILNTENKITIGSLIPFNEKDAHNNNTTNNFQSKYFIKPPPNRPQSINSEHKHNNFISNLDNESKNENKSYENLNVNNHILNNPIQANKIEIELNPNFISKDQTNQLQ